MSFFHTIILNAMNLFKKYWQPCDPALRCNHYNYMGNQSDMQSIMVPVVCHH